MRTEADHFRDLGYQLVLKRGTTKERREAMQNRRFITVIRRRLDERWKSGLVLPP